MTRGQSRRERTRLNALLKKKETEHHESDTTDEKENAQERSPASLANTVSVGQAEAPKAIDGASSNNKTEQSKQRSDRWMTRFTGLIFFVTAIYALISF